MQKKLLDSDPYLDHAQNIMDCFLSKNFLKRNNNNNNNNKFAQSKLGTGPRRGPLPGSGLPSRVEDK